MEQDGSTSCLTVFKILGCCLLQDHFFTFFLLTNEITIGGSDGGEGRSVWYLVGQNTWQRMLPANSAAKVGLVLSKIIEAFLK